MSVYVNCVCGRHLRLCWSQALWGAVVSAVNTCVCKLCVNVCGTYIETLCFHGNAAVCKLSPKGQAQFLDDERTVTGPQTLQPSGDPDTGSRQGVTQPRALQS